MSTRANPTVRIVAWGFLGIVLVAVVMLFVRSQASRSSLPQFGQIKPFVLTNQLGAPVTSADLRGRVWVADIIFSRCAGPCPRMTEEMSKLQNAFPPGDPLRFVTLTTDPDYDKPSVLKTYGDKFGADPSRWFFLTGPKSDIKSAAMDSLKLATQEKDEAEQQNPNDLFIHTTVFVLVDKNGVMRGAYESEKDDFQEKIRADIQALLRESP